MKHAQVRPLLKKPGLDADNLKNYPANTIRINTYFLVGSKLTIFINVKTITKHT